MNIDNRKILGVLPNFLYDYDPTKVYNLLQQVTYLGSTFQSKCDNNNNIPCVIIDGVMQVHESWTVIARGSDVGISHERLDNVEKLTNDLNVEVNNLDTDVKSFGTDVNNLTEVVLDKTYDPVNYSGLGRVILKKKKAINGKNILTQDMINQPNTIYEIQYDFDLNGINIIIPIGCVLKFIGGSLSNGTIIGSNTKIDATVITIFSNNIIISGTYSLPNIYPEWFGAIGDGITDDYEAIQKTIDSFVGKITISPKTYAISKTIKLRNERILIGCGSGSYFRGSGYNRLSVIKPTTSFYGDRVISADPKDISGDASYSYGVSLRDLCIDCINIKNKGITIIALMSVSNTETFDSIRVINNNTNVALWIDKSTNVNGMQADGIIISNMYCLDCDEGAKTSNIPLVKIGDVNEISLRDCKFQKGASTDRINYPNSVALLINASLNGSVNAASNGITIDSCSFTSAECGVKIVGNNSDANGPRYVRVLNCTWEYCKYPIYCTSNDVNKPVQFCSFGSGNRVNARTNDAVYDIVFDKYVANCIIYATDDIIINCNESTIINNYIIGGSKASLISNRNCWLYHNLGVFKTNNSISWTDLTLLNGWTNASPSNRTIASYYVDTFKVVHLRGYLSSGSYGYPNYIFNLPVEARPKITQEITISDISLTIGIDGNVHATGNGANLRLDGISFTI